MCSFVILHPLCTKHGYFYVAQALREQVLTLFYTMAESRRLVIGLDCTIFHGCQHLAKGQKYTRQTVPRHDSESELHDLENEPQIK